MTKPTGFIGPTTLKLFAGYDKRGLYFQLSFNYLIQFDGSYDGVRRVSGLRREPAVPLEDSIPIPSCCEFCAGVPATRRSESATRGSGSYFSVGCEDQRGVLHGDSRFPT